MDIIIAGAGKVGFELARSLSNTHQVTIIDQNEGALDRLGELIDIYPVVGNIEDPATFAKLPDDQADVFIAVTDSDEANLLATLLVDDKVEIKRKIIRLKNSYFAQSSLLGNLQNLHSVFPYQLVADTMKLLMKYPEANNVKEFANTNMKLISVKVNNINHEDKFVGLFENRSLKIVAIERDKEMILPNKEDMVLHGDLIYFLGSGEVLKKIYAELDIGMPHQIKNVVIFGADRLGVEIANAISSDHLSIKMIEKDLALCERASEILQDRALIINSHYDETILYSEENLADADIMISTDTQDESNIIRALQAQENGIKKIIAINNEKKYYPLMHQLGIAVARGPQTNAYYSILEYLSASETTLPKHFCGGKGVIYSKKITNDDRSIGKLLPNWAHGDAIVLVERDKYFIPYGETITIHENDIIYISTKSENEEKAKRWIESL